MDNAKLTDSLIFSTKPEALLSAVRQASTGADVAEAHVYLLSRCGFMTRGKLTDAGNALFRLAWVLRREKEAFAALGQALRQLNPLQVIEQELRGLGPVPEDGVLDLLRHHKAIPNDAEVADLRPLMRWLNSAGLIAYSSKLKTIRSLAVAPDAALAGEIPSIAGMISPRTPFRNVVKLRRVIRPLKGIVWWADPHFAIRALEELAENLDLDRVDEVRIISGDAENVVTAKSLKDFSRFQQEMTNFQIKSEWRIDVRGTRDWHDRWLGDENTLWNVPPINTLFKNDYSEISPASERPPLDHWWSRGTPR